MKKCLLYVLSFAVLSIGLFISFSDDATAWNPDTQTPRLCQNHPSPPSNYPRIRAGTFDDWAGFTPSGDINNPDASFMVRSTYPETTTSGVNTMDYTLGDGFYFREHPETPGHIVLAYDITTTQTGNFRKNKWSSYTVNYYDYTPGNVTIHNDFSSWYPTGNYEDADFAYAELNNFMQTIGSPTWGDSSCIHLWQNIRSELPQNLYSKLPDEFKTDNNEYFPPDCGLLEFTCWLPNIIDSIGGTIEGGITAVIKAITWLFTPDSAAFQNSFDELIEFFSEKLGFLFYPFELLERIYNSLVNADNGSSTMLGTYCLPNSSFFGSNFCIRTNRSGLLQAIRPLMQGLIALALIQGFRYKYKEVVYK